MKFGLSLKAGGLLETLNLSLARIEDLGPPLKQIGKEKRAEVKEIFDTEGAGKWAALAESTIEHREHQGTSKVTEQGGARAGYMRFLQARAKGIETSLRRQKEKHNQAHPILGGLLGITHAKATPKVLKMQAQLEGARAKLAALTGKAQAEVGMARELRQRKQLLAVQLLGAQKRLQAPRDAAHADKLKALIENHKQSLADLQPLLEKAGKADVRRRGKSASLKKRRMLGKIGQSIGAEVHVDAGKFGGFLVIRARLQKPILGKVHNDGDGHVPMRKFLELTPANVARIKEILIAHGLAPLQGRL